MHDVEVLIDRAPTTKARARTARVESCARTARPRGGRTVAHN